MGLFSTRSPHRPNPIGLTLAVLDQVKGSQIHLSGLDLLSGTPILDIKPYIPNYDMPARLHEIVENQSDPSQPEKLVSPSDPDEPGHSIAFNDAAIKVPNWITTKANLRVENVADLDTLAHKRR